MDRSACTAHVKAVCPSPVVTDQDIGSGVVR